MRIKLDRWPMCGGGLAYSVHVPIEDAPKFLVDRPPAGSNRYVTRIGQDGGEFFEYPQATSCEAHHDRDQGWDKYEEWMAHEKQAHAAMLRMLQDVFPETRGLTEYPTLWVSGLMERDEERNAAKTIWIEG